VGKIVGSTGKLFIVEATTPLFKIMKKNIYLNELDKISTLYNLGASNYTGTGKALLAEGNSGGSKIISDTKKYTAF
jgi:hypothetical protein